MGSVIPKDFLWRRLHSLTGLFFALFLIEHLLVNSQAALFIGDDGEGFIYAVNSIHHLPYLPLIEIFLLAVPILIHMIWGVKYLLTSKENIFTNDGTVPYLPEYRRNKAYTWQRITSWILLFGVIAHVIHMRFLDVPQETKVGSKEYFFVEIEKDKGLDTVAKRLNVKLIENESKPTTVTAEAPDFGTAELLIVRDAFKSPVLIALYTLFVLCACFHGFNGLWSFMIKWGVTISERSQRSMLAVSTAIMVIVSFLGLSAIWGTFWLNLKQ